jgi:signal transduction histidine kinase/transcriptional regulator with GAF, ATPase, and Fis domain
VRSVPHSFGPLSSRDEGVARQRWAAYDAAARGWRVKEPETRGRSFSSLLRSSTALGWAAAFLAPAAISSLDALSNRPSFQLAGFLYLLAVSLAAYLGGFPAGLTATVLSTLGLAFFYTPPRHDFIPANGDQGAGVTLFFIVALLISQLFERRRQDQREAEAASARANRLQAVTARLAEAVTPQQVLDAIVTEGVEAAEARAGAIGLLTPDGETIEIVAQRGYERNIFVGWETFPLAGETPMATAIREDKPFFFETSAERNAAFPSMGGLEGPSHALAILPLVVEGRAIGGIAFTFPTEIEFDAERRALKATLAQQAAQAIDRVRLYEAERALRQRMTFLADASELLGSSLDYEATLAQLARLAVPEMATWCSVDMVGLDGSIRRLAVAHEDPDRVAWAERLGDEYPPDPDQPMGVPNVIRTMTAEFVPEITDELLVEAAQGDERLLEIVRELGLRSAITVPLVARGRALGALSLIRDESAPRYSELDLDLASELARRAASAVDNAILYREAERRGDASRALAHVDDGVVLLDEEGVVVSVNPAAARILSVEAAAVMGETALGSLAGWSEVEDNARPARGETRGPVTLPLVLSDGTERWVSVSGVDFGDGAVYALRDVTAERLLERTRSDFVATASHELRTPLSAVLGAVKTLRRADVDLDPEQREMLMDMIDSEAERLSGIVSQILLTGQIDAGRLPLEHERFDPVELTRSVVDSAELHLPSGIGLHVRAEEDVPPVSGDPNQLRQVLSNLVDNAIKYSPQGGDVELRLNRNGQFARIEVADCGLGIPSGEHDRIFEKFYRLDPALTRGVNGTGLGLYISKELVERMNGRISVDSEPGRGSTFVVEVPLAV